jgi:hypothetical protein
MKIYKNAMKYFGKHPEENGLIHLILGLGLGFLLTYPVAQSHPIRWGVLFIVMGVVGHIWAGMQKTK